MPRKLLCLLRAVCASNAHERSGLPGPLQLRSDPLPELALAKDSGTALPGLHVETWGIRRGDTEVLTRNGTANAGSNPVYPVMKNEQECHDLRKEIKDLWKKRLRDTWDSEFGVGTQLRRHTHAMIHHRIATLRFYEQGVE